MIYFIGEPSISNSTIEELIEYFKDKSEISFDTETTGFDPYIDKLLAYQLGNGVHQFVVDASRYPIELIKDILINKELLIHNAKFDLKFLYHVNIYPKRVWDTYLAECVLYKGDKTARKSLEVVVNKYLNYNLDKTMRSKIFREGFTKRVIKYCAEDVTFLIDIKACQYDRLKKLDLLVSMKLENLFVKVLTYIEYSGIYLDKNLWNKKIQQDTEIFNNNVNVLNKWLIDNNIEDFIDNQLNLFYTDKKANIQWSSPKQVIKLFNKLGIDTKIRDDKTGELKDSVEVSVIEKQINKSDIIPIYIAYKKSEKLLSTYGEDVLTKIHPITGRIHTSFTQIMSTGRLSSGGKIGDKDTINLQNIPRIPDEHDRIPDKIYERDCFTADKENILINADYSGQEQVIFANWTLDKDLLEFYRKDLGDMHSFVASKIFPYLKDVSLKEIKSKYKKERQIAKSAGFAINYGGDGSTIADNLNISLKEGTDIYNAYFKAFPGMELYSKTVSQKALRDGYVLFNNISGSKCFIPFYDEYKKVEKVVNKDSFWLLYNEEKSKNSILFLRKLKPIVSKYFKLKGKISRMALNFPIQGSAAEITKLACIYIFDYLLKNNLLNIVKFSNVVHDEVLLECPIYMAKDISEMVNQCMLRAGKIYCKVIPLKVDVKICEFWNH